MFAKEIGALAMLVSIAIGEMQAHGNVRGVDSMAMVVSDNTQIEGGVAENSCDVSNGRGCQRQLQQHHEPPPEFVPTSEWQDILPNQAIPPGLYIRVNLETGKKEAKLLD